MANRVCPVWVAYLLASPVRKLLQNPDRILKPYLQPGMMALDLGCAMGFFSLPMAERVKPNGKVVCSDLQERMIQGLEKRARKVGLSEWIETHVCKEDSLGLEKYAGKIDFALAVFVLHEIPDQSRFLTEVGETLKPSGRFLISEPKGHVRESDFEKSVSLAERANFRVVDRPRFSRALSVLLERNGSGLDSN